MDTLAPQSLLDSRSSRSTAAVQDRLTRRTSPGRNVSVQDRSYDDDDGVVPRVPQPYRTSFSAIAKPDRTLRNQSRSTSPGVSSIKSNRSRSKSPGHRKHSPKHVTYDDKVTVRHSDSVEHQTAALSEGDHSNDSTFDRSYSDSSETSVGDYSSRIREMSQLIANEYSSSQGPERDLEKSASPEIVNKPSKVNGKLSNRNNQQFSKNNLSKEYNHDRTVSYRKAITDHYSSEVKRLADSYVEETYPETSHDSDFPGGRRTERSNSVPSHPRMETENKLTPAKKTISGSINNFLRRLSPRVMRKGRRYRGSTSSVSSHTDSVSGDQDVSGNLSRNKTRWSFMKLLGKNKSRNGSTSGEDKQTAMSDSHRGQGHQLSARTDIHQGQGQQMPSGSNRILKSIEQNTMNDRDVYQKFKDRQSPSRIGEATPAKMQAVKVPGEVTHENIPSGYQVEKLEFDDAFKQNKENECSAKEYADSKPDRIGEATPAKMQAVRVPGEVTHQNSSTSKPDRPRISNKPEPPQTLDVRQVPKSVKILQSSMYSSLSADGSIGECSLDANITGSEPSLLSDSDISHKVVLSQKENLSYGSERDYIHSPVAASTPAIHLSQRHGAAKENMNCSYHSYSVPKLVDSADFTLPDCSKIPSYLRISRAVSGYGQYSSYKSIEKRSPFSSCSSLRSETVSPEMPVTKVISPTPWVNVADNHISKLRSVNGTVGDHSIVTNGHTSNDHIYPTGDKKVDGEYFLHLTRLEENRILSQCRQLDSDINCTDLPEEAHGKIRAAIGKANLLVNQKFKQFEDLCSEHMNPSEDSKLLLWKDLQGFWDMIKIQIDNVDEMFTEIELVRQNGWKELSVHSRGSSVSSSPKSGSLSLSNTSTPVGTPGSNRKLKIRETPESSPERTEKLRQAAKVRDEARKRLLAERRAAMKQKQKAAAADQDIQIFISEASQ